MAVDARRLLEAVADGVVLLGVVAERLARGDEHGARVALVALDVRPLELRRDAVDLVRVRARVRARVRVRVRVRVAQWTRSAGVICVE